MANNDTKAPVAAVQGQLAERCLILLLDEQGLRNQKIWRAAVKLCLDAKTPRVWYKPFARRLPLFRTRDDIVTFIDRMVENKDTSDLMEYYRCVDEEFMWKLHALRQGQQITNKLLGMLNIARSGGIVYLTQTHAALVKEADLT